MHAEVFPSDLCIELHLHYYFCRALHQFNSPNQNLYLQPDFIGGTMSGEALQ